MILWKFQIFSCSIHGEIPKTPLPELCEKENRKKGTLQTFQKEKLWNTSWILINLTASKNTSKRVKN